MDLEEIGTKAWSARMGYWPGTDSKVCWGRGCWGMVCRALSRNMDMAWSGFLSRLRKYGYENTSYRYRPETGLPIAKSGGLGQR